MLTVDKIDVCHGDLQALWSVSFIVEDRQIVVLIGSNGAGKTTTIRTISGLHRPIAGSVRFNEERLSQLPVHKIVELGICMVPEGRRLFPGMTVTENLDLGSFVGRARQDRGETIRWVYDIFPVLKNRASQAAGTLSGGEQQMLAIGRALMSQPKLLLIDELSLGLSPVVVQNMCTVVRQINESREIAILMVEQNVRMGLELAHRGYIIENGRIVAQGDAKTLLHDESVKDAYLGLGQQSQQDRA